MTPGSGGLARTGPRQPPGGPAAAVLPAERQPVIIAARRTPIRRANGTLKDVPAHALLAPVLRSLLADAAVPPGAVADVIIR